MKDIELELLEVVSRQGGAIALSYWNKGLQAETKSDASPVTIADRECERAISRALEECHGNRTEAAKRLGISRRTLQRKLKKVTSEK